MCSRLKWAKQNHALRGKSLVFIQCWNKVGDWGLAKSSLEGKGEHGVSWILSGSSETSLRSPVRQRGSERLSSLAPAVQGGQERILLRRERKKMCEEFPTK